MLNAAVEIVARNGYVETTVEQLIEFANASRSTFYSHFRDKDECIRVAAERIVARLMSAVGDRAAGASPQSIPQLTVAAMLEFAEQEQAQARVLFTELLAGGMRARDLRDAAIDQLAELIEAAWQRGADQRPTLDLPARALIGGVFRHLSFQMRRGGDGPYELESSVLAWTTSYALVSGEPRWQGADALDALELAAGPELSPMMPPPPLPKGRHGRPARALARNHLDRLLYATAACVYEKGYAAVSVADIVREAKVSRSAFYNRFPDKEAAVVAAVQFTYETSMARCATAFTGGSDWPTQLWAGARALSDYYATAPSLVYLGFVEGYAVGAAPIQVIKNSLMAFTLLLERGYQLRPEGAPLDRDVSKVIASATFELAYREVRQRQPGVFSRLLPQLAYLNLAPFMGADRATEFIYERCAR